MKKTTSLLILISTLASLVPGCTSNGLPAEDGSGNTSIRDDGVINAIKNMTTQRAAHSATLLPDGQVLIAGGFAGSASGLASAEIFDPATATFTSIGNMHAARSGHSATLLPDGKVLIAGGYNGAYLATAELYDPASRSFTPTAGMVTARSGHVATLLSNGKVLLAGGVGTGWTFLADAELYDPSTGMFTRTGGMATARESHTATRLKDGRVLITGGHKDRRPAVTIYSSTEIYDPRTATFSAGANLTVRRHKHDATLLADGRVLITGGSDERDGEGAYRNAEIFNPVAGAFSSVGNMNTARYKLQGTTVLLSNGKVLIAGGAARAEVFDPATNSFAFAGGDLGTTWLFAMATLLKNGQVLITGGYDEKQAFTDRAWMYRPDAGPNKGRVSRQTAMTRSTRSGRCLILLPVA